MQILEKIESAKASKDCVLFAWRYKNSKLEKKYVSLTNIRFEAIQIHNGKMLFTQAAPVIRLVRGKSSVVYYDKDVFTITEGKRAGINVLSSTLLEGEVAHEASSLGTIEVTADTDARVLSKIADMLSVGGYPGIDMREPEYFRCTKRPEKLKLNFSSDLMQAIKAKPGSTTQELKESFLAALPTIGLPTTSGWVVPYDYVFSGGMVIADGTVVIKSNAFLQERPYAYFLGYVNTHGWNIQTIEGNDDFFRASK